MSHRPILSCLAALAVATGVVTSTARADVQDAAHVFSRAAVDQSDAFVGGVKAKFAEDVVVETIAAVAADQRSDAAGAVRSVMVARTRAKPLNGVYVLICLDPVAVGIGAEGDVRRQKVFDDQDIASLHDLLQSDVAAKRYDDALNDAVDTVVASYISHRLASQASTRPATQPVADGLYVHDGAHLFSDGAVTDGEASAAAIARRYRKQVVVETFPAVPAEDRAAVAEDKDGYFKRWLADRFKARDVNGVYVLICMDPRTFRATMGKQTLARGIFTANDLGHLTLEVEADLKAGQYDAALADAINQANRAYASHLRRPVAADGGTRLPDPP